MERARLKLWSLVAILALVAACATAPAPLVPDEDEDKRPEQPASEVVFRAAAGTFQGVDGEVLTLFLVDLDAPEVADGAAVQVTISGPAGWNADEAFVVEGGAVNGSARTTRHAAPPVDGAYDFTVVLAGEEHAASATIAAGSLLPYPADLTVISKGAGELDVAWSGDSNAHDVFLWHPAADSYEGPVSAEATSATLSGLTLADGEYAVYVEAFAFRGYGEQFNGAAALSAPIIVGSLAGPVGSGPEGAGFSLTHSLEGLGAAATGAVGAGGFVLPLPTPGVDLLRPVAELLPCLVGTLTVSPPGATGATAFLTLLDGAAVAGSLHRYGTGAGTPEDPLVETTYVYVPQRTTVAGSTSCPSVVDGMIHGYDVAVELEPGWNTVTASFSRTNHVRADILISVGASPEGSTWQYVEPAFGTISGRINRWPSEEGGVLLSFLDAEGDPVPTSVRADVSVDGEFRLNLPAPPASVVRPLGSLLQSTCLEAELPWAAQVALASFDVVGETAYGSLTNHQTMMSSRTENLYLHADRVENVYATVSCTDASGTATLTANFRVEPGWNVLVASLIHEPVSESVTLTLASGPMLTIPWEFGGTD